MSNSIDPSGTIKVVMIRHAQSTWNLENRFSGWADPPLTDAGRQEAEAAGRLLRDSDYQFDLGFTSRLQRARETLTIILDNLTEKDASVVEDWRLNERHYGALQGKIKTPEANNTTPEQIWRWRRSFLEKAEPLDPDDPRHPRNSPLYKDVDASRLPAVENLAEARERVMEVWHELILPEALARSRIIISAHGNSLRALLMGLADMSVPEVEAFEIPTGSPLVVEMDSEGRFIQWYYLSTTK